jgi:hypothetical protein
VVVQPSGTLYDQNFYNDFFYGSSQAVIENTLKSYPAVPCIGYSIAPGVTETSTNPFSVIALVVEATIDPPAP